MRWKLEQILKKTGGGIVFEDESIIVINKPSGMLTAASAHETASMNLYELLRESFPSVFVVHKVDADVSGLVVFAKTAEAQDQLCTQFEQHKVKKQYLAIVHGVPKADSGIIELPLADDERCAGKKMVDRKKGIVAATEYITIEHFDRYALLGLSPHTERTHQIRVQLSAIKMPVLADPLYGDGQGFFLSFVKKNYKEKEPEKPLLARTALHVAVLAVVHPLTKELLEWKTPLPKDMDSVLKYLRKFCAVS
ncbi:MAG TPA: RluA family pseudouridine synthase [Bacteroidota bacterium]|nr:RluA family pseudouridine synthase [Bacteroidota bacterium]